MFILAVVAMYKSNTLSWFFHWMVSFLDRIARAIEITDCTFIGRYDPNYSATRKLLVSGRSVYSKNNIYTTRALFCLPFSVRSIVHGTAGD